LAISSFNPNESWLNKYDLPTHVTKKLVTLDVQNSFALVKPVREGTTQVQIMLTSDPKMDFVPQTLVTWAIKNFAYSFLAQIKQSSGGSLSVVKEIEKRLR